MCIYITFFYSLTKIVQICTIKIRKFIILKHPIHLCYFTCKNHCQDITLSGGCYMPITPTTPTTMVIIKFVWRMQLSINDVTVAKIITTLWEGIVVFVVSNLFNKVCYGVRWWIRNFIKHPVCYHWNKVPDKSLYSRSVNLEYNSYTNKNTWSFRNLFQSDSLCCIDLEAKKKVCTPALFYACQRGRSWKVCCPENSN